MIRYLWNNRTRPTAFSATWVKTWLKRIYHAKGLLAFAWMSWSLRMRGALIAKTAICSRMDFQGKAAHLTIGEHCSIGRVSIQSMAPLTIGNNVVINDGARLITGSHDVNDPAYRHICRPIVVEDYAWIAMGAIILQGVRIGRGAVVGAGAVITRDVAPYAIVAGNPARIISQRQTREFVYRPARWFAAMEAWLGPDVTTRKGNVPSLDTVAGADFATEITS